MGFSLHSVGNWLVGAGRAVGKQFDHLATGAIDVAKAVVNQPIALAHELSGAVVGVSKNLVGVAHEAGGALVESHRPSQCLSWWQGVRPSCS